MHYKTVVISDVHIGTKDSKVKELTEFLKKHTFDKLILNGDIIDGWNLKRFGKWRKRDTKFLRYLFKLSEKTQIVYIRGNHDDFLEKFIPFKLKNISITNEITIYSNNNKYLVIHGDIFDLINKKFKWIAKLGGMGYNFLLWVNRIYNKYREKKGLPYYSLSNKIKKEIKFALNYIHNFENKMIDYCKSKNYNGVITGHIHHAEKKTIKNIQYMNSGDWVESKTALVETKEENWKIIYY